MVGQGGGVKLRTPPPAGLSIILSSGGVVTPPIMAFRVPRLGGLAPPIMALGLQAGTICFMCVPLNFFDFHSFSSNLFALH